MKIIIIGSIAAGVSAAARLAAAQRGAQITVYEKGGFYSCGTGGLPHCLCEDRGSLNKAIQAKETELNAQGITAHLRHEVRGIDAAARKVTVCDLATGRVFEDHYDKLVLATGSSNRVPQVPGSDRVGVQTLKTVEDLIFLKEFVRTPYVRDIVILGGSWAGLEIAKRHGQRHSTHTTVWFQTQRMYRNRRQRTCRLVLPRSRCRLRLRQRPDFLYRRCTVRTGCGNRHQHTEAARPRSDGFRGNHHVQGDYLRRRTDKKVN